LKALCGWKIGEVLGRFTPNGIHTPTIIWGTHWAGEIVSPANTAYTIKKLAFQLKDSQAKVLVTQKSLLKEARAAAKIAGIHRV
jgi:4-coumarate--CoA ligase